MADPRAVAALVRRCLAAIDARTPEEIAASLGAITQASSGAGPRLLIVSIGGSIPAAASRAQIMVGSNGAVRAVVLEFDPADLPSLDGLVSAFGPPDVVPGPEAERWRWLPGALEAPATLFADPGPAPGSVAQLTVRPETAAGA